MGNEILDAIHSAEPPLTKVKAKKKTPEYSFLDSSITPDFRNFAKALYDLFVVATDIKAKPFYELESSIELNEATTELPPNTEKTSTDNKYINFAKSILQPEEEYVYAFKLLKAFAIDVETPKQDAEGNPIDGSAVTKNKLFGIIKDKASQLECLRSMNHLLKIKFDKKDDDYYNYFSTPDGKKLEEPIKKIIPEVYKSLTNDPMNRDFNRGIDPAVINGLAKLCNDQLKDSNGKKLNIKPFELKDKLSKDIAAKIDKANNGFLDSVKMGLKFNGLNGALNAVASAAGRAIAGKIMGESITELAITLREAAGDPKEKEFQDLKKEYPNKPFSEYNSYAELEASWKSDNQTKKDQEDSDFVNKNLVSIKDAKGLHNFIKTNPDKLEKFLDVISRAMFTSSNGKSNLHDYNEKADSVFSKNWKEFRDYISKKESANRRLDQKDVEEYTNKKNLSEYDATLADFKRLSKAAKEAEEMADNLGIDTEDLESEVMNDVKDTLANIDKETDEIVQRIEDELEDELDPYNDVINYMNNAFDNAINKNLGLIKNFKDNQDLVKMLNDLNSIAQKIIDAKSERDKLWESFKEERNTDKENYSNEVKKATDEFNESLETAIGELEEKDNDSIEKLTNEKKQEFDEKLKSMESEFKNTKNNKRSTFTNNFKNTDYWKFKDEYINLEKTIKEKYPEYPEDEKIQTLINASNQLGGESNDNNGSDQQPTQESIASVAAYMVKFLG